MSDPVFVQIIGMWVGGFLVGFGIGIGVGHSMRRRP
jgi:hypothetical protein